MNPTERSGASALLAAAIMALGACGNGKPRTIVAAPAVTPPASPSHPEGPDAVEPPAITPGPAQEGALPTSAHGPAQEGALPTSAQLLAQVEALEGQLEGAPKTVEIMTALGDLYYENQRLADALSWYDRSVEAAQPVWKTYLALPAAARTATPTQETRERCVRGPARGHAELAADARAHAAKGDLRAAAACYRSALEPAVLAEIHRANAWFLAGDARRAIAGQEAVLARLPGHPEATFFLGLFLAETAGEDVAQLRRARALLEEVARQGAPPQRATDLRHATDEIDRRIATAGIGGR